MAMTERSVTHGSFRLERTYDAKPARVFRAFSDVEAKKAWFTGSGEADELERTMDFRVGGRERVVGRWNGQRITSFECLYYDIIENERIIYSYEMHQDDIRISVSLATLEFHTEGGGTRLVMSEYGAFLDGFDGAASREEGTRWLLDRIGASLESELV
jgi:uncharacterized protein YndB with AHSA1/START domain